MCAGDLLQLIVICFITIKSSGEILPSKKIWKPLYTNKLLKKHEFTRTCVEIIEKLYATHNIAEEITIPVYCGLSESTNQFLDIRRCSNENCNNFEKKNTPKFKKCSKCCVAYYCSAECQKAHWKAHKPLCKPVVTTLCSGDEKTAGGEKV